MNNKKENSPFNRNEINREKILKIWEDNDVFNKSQEINRGLNKGDFTFNLAPLFVGKSIEVKECIEDVVIRRRLMEGFFLPDVDSWRKLSFTTESNRLMLIDSFTNKYNNLSFSLKPRFDQIVKDLHDVLEFIFKNLEDFDLINDRMLLTGMHRYISEVTQNYEFRITKLYKRYELGSIMNETIELTKKLNEWYFDYAQIPLSNKQINDNSRRAVQTNLANILRVLIHALAPLLPFTIEYAYSLVKLPTKKLSIFLERQSYTPIEFIHNTSEMKFDNKYRPRGEEILEKALANGVIDNLSEAILTIPISKGDIIATVEEYASFFKVAKVIIGDAYIVTKYSEK